MYSRIVPRIDRVQTAPGSGGSSWVISAEASASAQTGPFSSQADTVTVLVVGPLIAVVSSISISQPAGI